MTHSLTATISCHWKKRATSLTKLFNLFLSYIFFGESLFCPPGLPESASTGKEEDMVAWLGEGERLDPGRGKSMFSVPTRQVPPLGMAKRRTERRLFVYNSDQFKKITFKNVLLLTIIIHKCWYISPKWSLQPPSHPLLPTSPALSFLPWFQTGHFSAESSHVSIKCNRNAAVAFSEFTFVL